MATANNLRLSVLSAADPSNSPTSREPLTDPLDIFGAITHLIEQDLGPEVLENLPESSLGAGAADGVGYDCNPPGDGGLLTLKSNLDELECAIERHGAQVEVRILSPSS